MTSGLSFATRAIDRGVGAENATITSKWFHCHIAAGAFKEIQACNLRNSGSSSLMAIWTINNRFHVSSYSPTIIGSALEIFLSSTKVVGNTACGWPAAAQTTS